MSTPSPAWLRAAPAFLRRRVEGRTNLLAVIHNTGWLFADKAMRIVVGVLVGAWVARYLGPSRYGELAYVLAFVAFLSVICQLGLDAVAIRDMARDPRAAPAILGTTLRLRLITGFAAYGAAILGMAILRPGDTRALVLTAIVAGTVIFQAGDTCDLWFQSQIQSKRTVAAKGVSYLVANGLKAVLILARASLVAFAVVALVEVMFAAVALWVAYRRYPAPSHWSWQPVWAKQLMRESWPYLLSGLAIVIYMRIDQIMLRGMVSEHELGIFSAALPVSTAWYFIPMAISASVGPTIARRKQNNPVAYQRAIAQLFSLMWWVMLPLSAAVALASGRLVAFLYGAAYAASAPVMAIHVFTSVPIALGIAQSSWIVNERQNMISLYRTVLGAVSNVMLNLLLIPPYGAVGAAIASVSAQLVAAVFSNLVLAPKIFVMQVSSLLQLRAFRA
ncbi:MAG: flippase [Gemmatimonadetes bacterium]|nr:MAG: flippase [Gemmatimonadota bacterium]